LLTPRLLAEDYCGAMHEEISFPELTEAVARLSALLGPRQGAVLALEGGITNRNFRVNFGGTDYVVRLPGKDTGLLGINREAERLATKKAAELRLGPRVAAMLDQPPCLVTWFVESREVTSAELREPRSIEEIGEALRGFHHSGLELPTDFYVSEVVSNYAAISESRGGSLPDGFQHARDCARRVVKAVRKNSEHQPLPCHNDLLTANFLHDGEHIVVVDWEYAGMGDPFFDLGNFAVNNELGDEEEGLLLGTYFGEEATPRRKAALKLFRFMSDFREGMWGVVQANVSEVDFDFGAYADKHFRRLAGTTGDARFKGWLKEAGGRSS
jgi:thiamine kinase-like enzyme